MDLLHDEWSSLDDGLREDPEATMAVLEAAARLDPGTGAAAMTPVGSYAVAVVGANGRRCYADPLFERWWPDDALPAATPSGRAGQAGVLSVLRDGEGRAVCCWVGDALAAARWALPQAAREALAAGRDRSLVVLFAPSQSTQLSVRIAAAFDLSRVEAGLVSAIMFAPTLDIAAANVGVGRETAKDILHRAMRKVGVRATPELVRKVMDLMCGAVAASPDDDTLLAEAFAITPAEARVASRMGEGLTAPQAAQALGIGPETARGYSKSTLSKLGVSRTKDVSRLVSEIGALANLVGAAEIVPQPSDLNLRIIPAADARRRIALLDYGPPQAEPLLIGHGAVMGRTLPAPFVRALQGRGLRPIVVQRPGFGLSDRAATDYLAAAAADLDVVCERLGLGAVRLVARANAAPAMLEFAARHPHRVRRGVLINPLTPLGFEQTAPGILTKISHTLMQHPKLTMTIVELFRRQSRSSLAEKNLRRSFERVEVDRLCLQNPDVVLSLVRDAQALTAHTSAGMADEMEVYGRGWRAPSLAGVAPWRIVHLDALACEPVFEPWRDLPGAELVVLAGAGRLADFTHPDELAALII